jgi:hypothetical protein
MDKVHLSNEDQAVNDNHDILRTYYKVALKRFPDNVVLQVTERILLGDNGQGKGPVRTLSPEFVTDLSEVELDDIAGEDPITGSARAEKQARMERLRKALELVKQT